MSALRLVLSGLVRKVVRCPVLSCSESRDNEGKTMVAPGATFKAAL